MFAGTSGSVSERIVLVRVHASLLEEAPAESVWSWHGKSDGETVSYGALVRTQRCLFVFSLCHTEILRAFDPRDESGMPCQYSSAACLFSRINADKCARRALVKTVHLSVHFIASWALWAFMCLCVYNLPVHLGSEWSHCKCSLSCSCIISIFLEHIRSCFHMAQCN